MRIVLLVLCAIPPILLVLSAAGAVHPLGDSLAVFRFHIGLFSVVSAYNLFRLGWRRVALGTAALALAASGSILSSYQHTHAHAETYSLYQKNLSFRLQHPTAVALDVRLKEPDFVTFQEVTTHNKTILTELEQTYPTQLVCDFARVGGVAVASRFPAVPGSARCGETKGMAAVQVQTPDGPVWLVSIHLHWPFPFGQADHVSALLPSLRALEGKVILAGDFNMVPWSYTMTRIEEATGARRLGQTNGTFLLEGLLMLPIDHVLAPTSCASETMALDLLGSDHHGVMAWFSLQNC